MAKPMMIEIRTRTKGISPGGAVKIRRCILTAVPQHVGQASFGDESSGSVSATVNMAHHCRSRKRGPSGSAGCRNSARCSTSGAELSSIRVVGAHVCDCPSVRAGSGLGRRLSDRPRQTSGAGASSRGLGGGGRRPPCRRWPCFGPGPCRRAPSTSFAHLRVARGLSLGNGSGFDPSS